MKRLILASASENRKKLLLGAGIEFDVEVSGFDEDAVPLDREPGAYAAHLALEKARAVAERSRGAVVLAADTVVALGGEIFNKPLEKARAVEILSKLSGTRHDVITGFAIVDADTGEEATGVEKTFVTFRTLSPEEIDRYAARGEDLDKAGGYAIQGGAAGFVEKIEGDISNAIGLPVAAVLRELAKFGLL